MNTKDWTFEVKLMDRTRILSRASELKYKVKRFMG